jgi:hypothetical protein
MFFRVNDRRSKIHLFTYNGHKNPEKSQVSFSQFFFLFFMYYLCMIKLQIWQLPNDIFTPLFRLIQDYDPLLFKNVKSNWDVYHVCFIRKFLFIYFSLVWSYFAREWWKTYFSLEGSLRDWRYWENINSFKNLYRKFKYLEFDLIYFIVNSYIFF